MLDLLKKLLPALETEVKAGRVSPAHYIIAAGLLLIADDMDSIRRSLASIDAKTPKSDADPSPAVVASKKGGR